jgi:geranylgeranylglycerol-phosphate geranylgeranyltransferase
LTRLNHGLLVAVAILVAEIIVLQGLPPLDIFLISALCGVLIQAASFTIGDYWDIETDKANKRLDRPLARGDVKKETAFAMAVVMFVLGVGLAALLNAAAFAIAIVFASVGIAYGYKVKEWALIGNIFTAAAMAIPFIFGAMIFTVYIPFSIITLAGMAFVMGVGREIVKGIQDMKGDKKAGRETFAIMVGPNIAGEFSVMFMAIAIGLSLLPVLFLAEYFMDPAYILFVGIADIMLIRSMLWTMKLTEFKKIRQYTLYVQLFALIGFLLGAVF